MWTEISNSLLCQQTTKKVFSLHAVLLNYLYIWLEYFQMKGWRGKKKKKFLFFQSTMLSLMNSTQISSLLCRWRLAVSEVWNKTNISWDRKPLMMKCSSHRNNWMQKDTVNCDMVENTLDNERGRLAESHLAPIHVNRQMRTHKRNNTYSIYTSTLQGTRKTCVISCKQH